MHILYPCYPFNKKIPDDYYREECEAVMDAGLSTYLFSFEDFEMGIFNTLPPILFNDIVLYRGWMLTPEGYPFLVTNFRENELLSPIALHITGSVTTYSNGIHFLFSIRAKPSCFPVRQSSVILMSCNGRAI